MGDVLGVNSDIQRSQAVNMYRNVDEARVRAAVALSFVVDSGEITQAEYAKLTGLSAGQVSIMKNAGDLLIRCGDAATFEVGESALSLVRAVNSEGRAHLWRLHGRRLAGQIMKEDRALREERAKERAEGGAW